MAEQVAEAGVGLLGGAEAGELAHRPEPAAVHRRVDPAGVRICARIAEVALGIRPLAVLLGVEGLHPVAGDRLEERLALLEARVDVGQPFVGTPARLGFYRHAWKSRRRPGGG